MLTPGLTQKNSAVIAPKLKLWEILTKTSKMALLKEYLFDDLLFKCMLVVEQTIAWLDAFKANLFRFEINAIFWKAVNLLACCVIFIT
jgi:hypothetical protein